MQKPGRRRCDNSALPGLLSCDHRTRGDPAASPAGRGQPCWGWWYFNSPDTDTTPGPGGDGADGDAPGQDEALCPSTANGSFVIVDDFGISLAKFPRRQRHVFHRLLPFQDDFALGSGLRRQLGQSRDYARVSSMQRPDDHGPSAIPAGRAAAGPSVRSMSEMKEVLFAACLSVRWPMKITGTAVHRAHHRVLQSDPADRA